MAIVHLESEYTKGNWVAKARHVRNDGTQDEITGMGWDVEGPPVPLVRGQFTKAADAYLVAAAPDLLEELEWAYSQLCLHPDWCDANHPVLKPRHDAIRAAIAKAKGVHS